MKRGGSALHLVPGVGGQNSGHERRLRGLALREIDRKVKEIAEILQIGKAETAGRKGEVSVGSAVFRNVWKPGVMEVE